MSATVARLAVVRSVVAVLTSKPPVVRVAYAAHSRRKPPLVASAKWPICTSPRCQAVLDREDRGTRTRAAVDLVIDAGEMVLHRARRHDERLGHLVIRQTTRAQLQH